MIEVPNETVLWRYMRLPQFIEMIMTSALYQTSVEMFDDPAEGAYGYVNTTIAPEVIAALKPPPEVRFVYKRDQGAVIEQLPLTKEAPLFEARKKTCVTCWYWHEGVESYAMWKVYGGGDFAVAIETTAGRSARRLRKLHRNHRRRRRVLPAAAAHLECRRPILS